jgi:MinD superfamily P-loop ATPase
MMGSRIVIAGGKGGTGKTTVATALAVALQRGLPEIQFLDCDVEGPDARLFLKTEAVGSDVVTVKIPQVNRESCTGCRQCQWVCRYNAVTIVSGKARISEDLCRGCGGCRLACPDDAATEKEKRIGLIETGVSGNLTLHTGVLDVGKLVPQPVIHDLKARARSDVPAILDSAPGTGSAVIPALRDSDYVVLVTDPTPFGFYELTSMMNVVNEFGLPAGIVINKEDGSSSRIEEFAAERALPILMRLPFSREIASLCSRGIALTEADTSWDGRFWGLYEEVERTIWRIRSK